MAGTVPFAINQLDVVLGGHLTPVVAVKIALTYAMPFAVSLYSRPGCFSSPPNRTAARHVPVVVSICPERVPCRREDGR